MAKYNQSTKGKEAAKRFQQTEKAVALRRKTNAKPINKLRKSLLKMVTGVHPGPVSIVSMGLFKDNADVAHHFESTMDKTWMTWENHGAHRKGNPYNTKWNVGHRLPVKIFDQNSAEDRARCFHRDNLFAQCARVNVESKADLCLTDEDLRGLKHLWPERCNGDILALKALF